MSVSSTPHGGSVSRCRHLPEHRPGALALIAGSDSGIVHATAVEFAREGA
jgi:hypothetical protein